jgi:hypothetical protein
MVATASGEISGINSDTLLSTVSSVDLNTSTKTTLFIVPTGKTCVITKVVIRNASAALVLASVGFGFDARAIDVIASTTYASLTGATLAAIVSPVLGSKVGSAADIFGCKCTILQGAPVTVTIDVFGYYF